MSLNMDELAGIDTATELVLTIFNDETRWKEQYVQLNKFSPPDSQTDILNVEGVLRHRISAVIRDLVDELMEESNPPPEEREPTFDPHELD